MTDNTSNNTSIKDSSIFENVDRDIPDSELTPEQLFKIKILKTIGDEDSAQLARIIRSSLDVKKMAQTYNGLAEIIKLLGIAAKIKIPRSGQLMDINPCISYSAETLVLIGNYLRAYIDQQLSVVDGFDSERGALNRNITALRVKLESAEKDLAESESANRTLMGQIDSMGGKPLVGTSYNFCLQHRQNHNRFVGITEAGKARKSPTMLDYVPVIGFQNAVVYQNHSEALDLLDRFYYHPRGAKVDGSKYRVVNIVFQNFDN